MQKIIGLLSVGVVIIVAAFLWHKMDRESSREAAAPVSEKISVVATFYPLASFAENIGGEKIEVRTIVPAGAEPHEYEPSQQDILATYNADVFLLNGAGLDPWAEKIRPELEKRGVKVMELKEVASLIPASEEESEDGNAFDPHFWLDPEVVKRGVENIAEILSGKDRENAEFYSQRKATFIRELDLLDNEYQNSLSQCKQDTIITSHNAFSYLAKRYNFKTISISGISPEAEPSPKRMLDLIELVRSEGIKYIFFETLVSPKVSETLATETGTTTLVFNPIEGLTDEEKSAGETYISIMKENLNNLKRALECQN